MDVEKATNTLSLSGSRFIQEGTRWLSEWLDPVPLLFVLTRETGPALGPWATFRWCALLGLGPSQAVRSLGEDVAAETPEFIRGRAAVDEAFAVAHVRDMWPALDPVGQSAITTSLSTGEPKADAMAALLALSLFGDDEELIASTATSLQRALESEPMHAVSILEASMLGAGVSALRDNARTKLRGLQDEDGLLFAPDVRRRQREWGTLHALALSARLAGSHAPRPPRET